MLTDHIISNDAHSKFLKIILNYKVIAKSNHCSRWQFLEELLSIYELCNVYLTCGTWVGICCVETKHIATVTQRQICGGQDVAHDTRTTWPTLRPAGVVAIVTRATRLAGVLEGWPWGSIVFLVAQRALGRFYSAWNKQKIGTCKARRWKCPFASINQNLFCIINWFGWQRPHRCQKLDTCQWIKDLTKNKRK